MHNSPITTWAPQFAIFVRSSNYREIDWIYFCWMVGNFSLWLLITRHWDFDPCRSFTNKLSFLLILSRHRCSAELEQNGLQGKIRLRHFSQILRHFEKLSPRVPCFLDSKLCAKPGHDFKSLTFSTIATCVSRFHQNATSAKSDSKTCVCESFCSQECKVCNLQSGPLYLASWHKLWCRHQKPVIVVSAWHSLCLSASQQRLPKHAMGLKAAWQCSQDRLWVVGLKNQKNKRICHWNLHQWERPWALGHASTTANRFPKMTTSLHNFNAGAEATAACKELANNPALEKSVIAWHIDFEVVFLFQKRSTFISDCTHNRKIWPSNTCTPPAGFSTASARKKLIV